MLLQLGCLVLFWTTSLHSTPDTCPPTEFLSGEFDFQKPPGLAVLGADPFSGELTAAMCNRTGRREPAAALSVLWSRCVIGQTERGKGKQERPARVSPSGLGTAAVTRARPSARPLAVSLPLTPGDSFGQGGLVKQRPLTCWSDSLSAGIMAMQPIGRRGAFLPAPYWPARSSTARILACVDVLHAGQTLTHTHAHTQRHADTPTPTRTQVCASRRTRGQQPGLDSASRLPRACPPAARNPIQPQALEDSTRERETAPVRSHQLTGSGQRSGRRRRNACHWTAFAGRRPLLPDARAPLGGCARDFLRITFNY
jgi:hypothetical protein